MQYDICNIFDYTSAQYDAMYRAASPERQARADRFRFEDDRRRCLCADMLARKMLAQAADCSPADVTFTYGEKGKPHANVPIHFNVSHAGDFVLCAVADAPLGVDIEQIKPFRAGLVGRYFTVAEADYVWGGNPLPAAESIDDPDTCARFYCVWTAKEAYVKMTGTGISTDLKKVCYDPVLQTVCGIGLITPNAPEGYVISILKSDLA